MRRYRLALSFGLLCACTSDPGVDSETAAQTGTDSSAETGSDSDASTTAGTDNPPAEDATLFAYLEAACPWESVCSGTTLDNCFSLLTEEDFAVFPNNYRAAGLADRTACARDATSCAEWEACSPTFDALLGGLSGDVENYSCPGDAEVSCDPATNVVLVCFDIDAGESPYEARELVLEGMVCASDERVRDEPEVACQEDVCDGALIRNCAEGATVTADCSFLHPDFQCETFNFGCAVPEPECEPNNLNNSGGSAQCEDDTTAIVCMDGKSFAVSCDAVGASCVNQGDLDASCE